MKAAFFAAIFFLSSLLVASAVHAAPPTTLDFSGQWALNSFGGTVVSQDGSSKKLNKTSYTLQMSPGVSQGANVVLYTGVVVGFTGVTVDMYQDPVNSPNFVSVYIYAQAPTQTLETNYQVFMQSGSYGSGAFFGTLYDTSYAVPHRVDVRIGQVTLTRPNPEEGGGNGHNKHNNDH